MKLISFANINCTQYQRISVHADTALAAFIDPLMLPAASEIHFANRRSTIFGFSFRDGLAAIEERFFSAQKNRERDRKIAYPISGVKVEQFCELFRKNEEDRERADSLGRFVYWYLAKAGVLHFEDQYELVQIKDFSGGNAATSSGTPAGLLLVRMAECASFAEHEFFPRVAASVEISRQLFFNENYRGGSVIPVQCLNYIRQLATEVDSAWFRAGPNVTYNYQTGYLMALTAIKKALEGGEVDSVLGRYLCFDELSKMMTYVNFIDAAVKLPTSMMTTEVDDGLVKYVVPRMLTPIEGYLKKWFEINECDEVARAFVKVRDITIPSSAKVIRTFEPAVSARKCYAFSLSPGSLGVKVQHNSVAAALFSSMIGGALDTLRSYSSAVLLDDATDRMGNTRLIDQISASLPSMLTPRLAMLGSVLKKADWSRTWCDRGDWTFSFPISPVLDDNMLVGGVRIDGVMVSDDLAFSFNRLIEDGVSYSPSIEAPWELKDLKQSSEFAVDLFGSSDITAHGLRAVGGPMDVDELFDVVKDATASSASVQSALSILGIHTDKLSFGVGVRTASELAMVHSFTKSALSYADAYESYNGALRIASYELIEKATSFYGHYVKSLFDVERELRSVPSPTRHRMVMATVRWNAVRFYVTMLNRLTTKIVDGNDPGLGSVIASVLAKANSAHSTQLINSIYDVNTSI